MSHTQTHVQNEPEQKLEEAAHVVCAHAALIVDIATPIYAACGVRVDEDGILPPPAGPDATVCAMCVQAMCGVEFCGVSTFQMITQLGAEHGGCRVCPQGRFSPWTAS